MLSELRQHSRSAIIYVLFGIIIAAFILTFNTMGPTSGCGGSTEVTLARVQGLNVDSSLFGMADFFTLDPPEPGRFDQRALQAQQGYESTRFLRANPDFGLMMGFMPERDEISPFKYRRVMDDLLETWLVSHVAEEMGMELPDQELAERVYQNPWLKDNWYTEDGKFVKRRFYEFVQFSLGSSATRYEDFIRREMLRERMIVFLSKQVRVSDAEVDYQWALENDEVDLEFVEFRPERLRPLVTVSDDEVTKAVAERAEAIAAYYGENESDYVLSERAQIHGIFLRAPLQSTIDESKDESDKERLGLERASARSKAEAIREELLAPNVDQADTEGQEPPADTDAEALARFEKVATEKSEFIQNKHVGGAFDEPKTREALAAWPFGPGVDEAVFALSPGALSEVIEVANGFWLVRLDGKLPAEERSLDEVRDEIARILLVEEREESEAKKLAEGFLSIARADMGVELAAHVDGWIGARPAAQVAEQALIEARRTGPFAIVSEDPDAPWGQVALIGHDEALARAAFALSAEAPVADQVFEVEKGGVKRWYVVRLAERSQPDPSGADEDKKAVRERLQSEKQRRHYRAWYANLLAKARAEGDVTESEDFQRLVESQMRAYEEAIKQWQERLQKQMGGSGGAPIQLNLD